MNTSLRNWMPRQTKAATAPFQQKYSGSLAAFHDDSKRQVMHIERFDVGGAAHP